MGLVESVLRSTGHIKHRWKAIVVVQVQARRIFNGRTVGKQVDTARIGVGQRDARRGRILLTGLCLRYSTVH